METDTNRKLFTVTIISVLLMILGTGLLVYMIIVEDEPGALPLLLIISGIFLFFFNRKTSKTSR